MAGPGAGGARLAEGTETQSGGRAGGWTVGPLPTLLATAFGRAAGSGVARASRSPWPAPALAQYEPPRAKSPPLPGSAHNSRLRSSTARGERAKRD
jgi:hypothetical protein